MRPAEVSPSASAAWSLVRGPATAHRGLWSTDGAPENALAAFAAAADAGYGIELDVRLSADGEVMVFHDETLARLCGRPEPMADLAAAELGALRLNGTGEPIPTLAETLARVDGRALIQVELKTRPGEEGPLDEAVARRLDAYDGPVAVIGFNARSHAWWAEHRPDVLRGLDCRTPGELKAAVKIGRPHFLALSTAMLDGAEARAARSAGFPIVAWTVRSPAEAESLRPLCDNIMFEGFRP